MQQHSHDDTMPAGGDPDPKHGAQGPGPVEHAKVCSSLQTAETMRTCRLRLYKCTLVITQVIMLLADTGVRIESNFSYDGRFCPFSTVVHTCNQLAAVSTTRPYLNVFQMC